MSTDAPRMAELLVIGPADRRAHLQQAMHELAPLLRGVDRLADAPGSIVPETGAIILLLEQGELEQGEPSSHGEQHGWARSVAGLRAALDGRSMPIVVVAEPGSANVDVRAAYDAGATAVLQWPTEVLLVHDLLRELLELPEPAETHAPADGALTEAVAARLRLDKILADRVSCRVFAGAAVVRGELASSWEHDRLIRLVEAVPGITHVIDHGIAIRPRMVPDDELDDTVASVVRSTGNVEARALETKVADGVVTIAGHAAVETATRVRNAVRAIPGVRRVCDVSTPDG